jgi:hypothetical protein
MVFVGNLELEKITKNIWSCDIGASLHTVFQKMVHSMLEISMKVLDWKWEFHNGNKD